MSEELFCGRMSSLVLFVLECRTNRGWRGSPEDTLDLMIWKHTVPYSLPTRAQTVPKVDGWPSGGVIRSLVCSLMVWVEAALEEFEVLRTVTIGVHKDSLLYQILQE